MFEFLNRLNPRRRHVMTVNGQRTGMPLWDTRFRRGMWVIVYSESEHPGILTAMNNEGIATVMLVDPELGTNLIEIHVHSTQLGIAHWKQIPIARRPSKHEAAAFGYSVI
jgi:hypothetical protein